MSANVCAMCDGDGVTSCRAYQCEHGGHTCTACGGSGWITPPTKKTLWWCDRHNSPTGDRIIDSGSVCFLVLDQELWDGTCDFVRYAMEKE